MIRLPMPPSVNAMFFSTPSGRRAKSKRYEAWIIEAGYEVVRQRPQKFTGDVKVGIRLGPRNRRADCDNRIKPVLDLLTKMRVIVDDRFVVGVSAEWAEVEGCHVIVVPADFNPHLPIENLSAHFAEVHKQKIASP